MNLMHGEREALSDEVKSNKPEHWGLGDATSKEGTSFSSVRNITEFLG